MQNGQASEAWRTVDGFPAYQVSDQGRLRRILSRHGQPRQPRILKLKKDKDGYAIAVMSVNGIYHYRRMARLVLFAFVGKPDHSDYQASHGNGIPDDDRLTNLRWAPELENQRDKFRHGTVTRGHQSNFAKLTEADVIAIRARVAMGETQHAVSRDLNIPTSTINNIVKRHSWRHVA